SGATPRHLRANRERAPREGQTNTYGHIVEIPRGCRVVYCPDNPLSCGARVWIETLHEVQIIG
ncbi:MAG: DNA-binding protein, partial [Lyngbya sp.]|nr:DNA-binding protein [Lyngbya sp.]